MKTNRGLLSMFVLALIVSGCQSKGSDNEEAAAGTGASAPNPPTNLTAVATSSTEITLSWSDNSTNEDGFQIQKSTDGGTTFAVLATTGVNTGATGSYTDTGLTPGTTLTYKVRAFNSVGSSDFTANASATTPTVLNAPTNLAGAVSGTGTDIDLTWAYSGTAVTNFRVESSTDNTTFTQIATPATTSYTDVNPGAGTHFYRVRAFKTGSPDAFSSYSNVTQVLLDKPVPPTNLAALAVSSGSLKLTWSDNSNNEQGFELFRSFTGQSGSFVQIGQTNPNVTTFTDSGLFPATTYFYQVRAFNAVGKSNFSNSAFATTFSGDWFELAGSATAATGKGGISQTSGGNSSNVSVAADGSGPIVVVWQENVIGTDEIFMSIYNVEKNGWFGAIVKIDSTGTKFASNVNGISANSGDAQDPMIVHDGVNSFYIFWQENRDGDFEILCRRMQIQFFDPSENKWRVLWTDVQTTSNEDSILKSTINLSNSSTRQSIRPQATVANGTVYVVWQEFVGDANSTKIFAVGNNSTILRSTNEGAAYAQFLTTLNAVQFVDANTGWAVGSQSGTVIKTTNGGTNWFVQASGTTNSLNGVSFVSATTGYAVGNNGTIIKTTNGGTNWSGQVSGTAVNLNGVHFLSATSGWTVGAAGTILNTINGGTLWNAQVSGVPAETLNSVFFADANNGWAVGTNGTIRNTVNAGTNWNGQVSGTLNSLNSIFFISTTTGWAVGNSGTILKTINSGANWTAQTSNSTQNLNSVFFTSANNGWAVGNNGTILFTSDGGTTWVLQPVSTANTLRGVNASSGTTAWSVGGSGLILNTTTTGTTWSAQSINPLNGIFFVGPNTGWSVGNGGTILKTTDGGTNWAMQGLGDVNGTFFVSTTTGWAAGANGVILKTTDGGATWGAQVSGTTSGLNSIFFINSATGWAVGDNGTILKTANGGTNWSLQISGTAQPLRSVFFLNSTTGWVSGSSGTLLTTTNGGTNWTAQNPSTVNNLSSVFFNTPDLGWAVGQGVPQNGTGTISSAGTTVTGAGTTFTTQLSVGDTITANAQIRIITAIASATSLTINAAFAPDLGGGTAFTFAEARIIRSIDGGISWFPMQGLTSEDLNAVFFIDSTTGWAVGTTGTILKTTDSGSSWAAQASGTLESLKSVFFTDTLTGYSAGTTGTILKTTNGGTGWNAQVSGTTQTVNGVFFASATTGWAVAGSGVLLRTTNGGTTWTPSAFGTAQNLNGLFFTNINSGWAVGVGGTILNTFDGGQLWQAQTSGTVNDLNSVYFINTTTGWAVGAAGTILKTTNGGTAWTALASGTANAITSVFFVDTNTGWVSTSAGAVLRTTNGGTTWTSTTVEAALQINRVVFVNAFTGWVVGNGSKIYRTTDAGVTWTAQTVPATFGAVNLNSIYFVNQFIGWIAGNSGKILTTINAGAEWVEQTSGSTENLKDVFVQYKSWEIYGATITGGTLADLFGANALTTGGAAVAQIGGGSLTGGGISTTFNASMYPSIAVTSGNVPFVYWQEFVLGHWQIYGKILAGGAWAEQVSGSASGLGISGNTTGDSQHPAAAVDASDRPYVTWDHFSGAANNYEIFIVRRSFAGTSFEALNDGTVTSAAGGGISNSTGPSFYPSIAIDDVYNVYVAWADATSGNWEIFVKKYAFGTPNEGPAWVAMASSDVPPGVSNDSGDSLFPTIRQAAGIIYLSWEDNTAASNNFEAYLKRW